MAADYEIDSRILDRLIQRTPAVIEDWLDGVAQQMTNEIVLSFGTSPAGREYKRGKKVHIASQENNPPNVDIGALRAGMKWRRSGRMEREISDSVEYGEALEQGTEHMGARPFVGPVFAKWQRHIEQDAVDYGLIKP
jgi:hypothetical protein